MSPFEVRREKAREVFLLVNRLRRKAERSGKTGERIIERNGKQILIRPAGDDWF